MQSWVCCNCAMQLITGIPSLDKGMISANFASNLPLGLCPLSLFSHAAAYVCHTRDIHMFAAT